MPRAQIKDEKTYRKLRDTGASKEKAARIANAAAASSASKVAPQGRQERLRLEQAGTLSKQLRHSRLI